MSINRTHDSMPCKISDKIETFNRTGVRAKSRTIESPIQIACVRWFRLQYPLLRGMFFSIPNGRQRNAITAKILASEGTLAGVSDLLLLVPAKGFHGLCIEMKTQVKGSRQSDSQRAFQHAVQQQGYNYIICRSLEEFIREIQGYLE